LSYRRATEDSHEYQVIPVRILYQYVYNIIMFSSLYVHPHTPPSTSTSTSSCPAHSGELEAIVREFDHLASDLVAHMNKVSSTNPIDDVCIPVGVMPSIADCCAWMEDIHMMYSLDLLLCEEVTEAIDLHSSDASKIASTQLQRLVSAEYIDAAQLAVMFAAMMEAAPSYIEKQIRE
jgi:Ribosome biogenesis protein C1orf109-like